MNQANKKQGLGEVNRREKKIKAGKGSSVKLG